MIVVFDGVCNLCNGWVRFLLRHDRSGSLRFASIQSETGRALLAAHGYRGENLDTLLVIDGERLYVKTEAILHVLSFLGWPWRALVALRMIPAFIRNPLYRRVATHRYRLFGRRADCALPAAAVAHRFLR